MLHRKLFLCVLLLGLSISTVSGLASDLTLPDAIKEYMATREMRYHHMLWHNIRNNWNQLSNATQQQITELGWACPRPARSFANGTSTQILDNGAGEDFFYMHRYMIESFNAASQVYNTSFGDVVGWKTVPAPGDEGYPVPANYTITNSTTNYNYTKTDSFYTHDILYYENIYTDPGFLRSVTLGELGARIEITIHNYMHLRFSSNSSYGYRPSGSIVPNVSTTWDNVEYDWMGDFYASQVNGYFWKLHGWVDDRIEDWRVANNLTEVVFNYTWIGGPMNLTVITSGETEEDMEMEHEVMPLVMQLMLQEVDESTPGDPVTISPPSYIVGSVSTSSSSTGGSSKRRMLRKICKSRSSKV